MMLLPVITFQDRTACEKKVQLIDLLQPGSAQADAVRNATARNKGGESLILNVKPEANTYHYFAVMHNVWP